MSLEPERETEACPSNPHRLLHCWCHSYSDAGGTHTRCCWCGKTKTEKPYLPQHGPFAETAAYD